MIRKFDEQLTVAVECYHTNNLIVSSILMTLTNLVFFLVCSIVLIKNDKEHLDQDKTKKKFGTMFEDINLKRSPMVKYYILMFLLRRILYCFIPTFYRDNDGI